MDDADTRRTQTAYKSARSHQVVRAWCSRTLAEAGVTTTVVGTSAGAIQFTTAGPGLPRIVLVPGTGSNAAVALPWLRALSAHWPTAVVDLPGQPGLSDPRRPRRARLAWYGRVLDDLLARTDLNEVVVVGNSLGAAVALAAASPRIAARVLISPAGFLRLAIDLRLAWASAAWLLRPTTEHTRAMLRLFVAPGEEPPEADVAWLSLMAATCRTTLAPPPLPADLLADRARRPCVVATGEHDRFLSPRRLAPVVERTVNAQLQVIAGMGHLTTPAHLGGVVALVARAVGTPPV